jgi:predicted methyltransferase MtxX (methanogen marker protein 4)
MIDRKQVRSLSDFQRNAREHIRRLKKTGKPEVLTLNGQAEVVVQSADADQKLLDAVDMADSVETLRQRLAAADRGAKGVPAKQVMAEIKKRLGLGGLLTVAQRFSRSFPAPMIPNVRQGWRLSAVV